MLSDDRGNLVFIPNQKPVPGYWDGGLDRGSLVPAVAAIIDLYLEWQKTDRRDFP